MTGATFGPCKFEQKNFSCLAYANGFSLFNYRDLSMNIMDALLPGFFDSADYMERHNPEVGGYYVVYEDGFVSYSPAGPFEKGYTEIADAASSDEPAGVDNTGAGLDTDNTDEKAAA